ncbi:MAG: gluconokinase [Gemmataceae bacterium]
MPGITIAQADAPFILAIDVGTSSVRALLYDASCRIIEPETYFGRAQVALQTDSTGMAVFEPSAVPSAVVDVVDTILAKLQGKISQIHAVAIDTFVSSMIGLDKNLAPITSLYTYADTRCSSDAQELRRSYNIEEIHERTGCMIHSSYLPARLHWEKRTNPSRFNSVHHWWSLGSVLSQQFLGCPDVSLSTASWTGLLDRKKLEWDQIWIRQLGLAQGQLPKIADFGPGTSSLKPEWCKRWPSLAKAVWFLAIGDGAAANIGSGCTNDHHVALTIGTTAAMRIVPSTIPEKIPSGLWNYRVDSKRPLVGGALTEGGNVHEWLLKNLKLPEPAECEKLLSQMKPAKHGLSMLPFFAGERAPGWRDDASATLHGIRLNTRPIDIFHAGLEAVALRLGQIYRRLSPLAHPDHKILASGGFLNSPAWAQIIANVLGKPIIACLEPEATSRGIAWLALESLGKLDLAKSQTPELGITFEPDPNAHQDYQEALLAQEKLYKKLLG